MRRFSFRPAMTFRGRKFKGLRGWAGRPFTRLSLPPLPGLRRWIGRKACQAYRRGFIENLTADREGAASASVGDLHPEPDGSASLA